MLEPHGLGIDIGPARDDNGNALPLDVTRDFSIIIRRVQLFRTLSPAIDMAAHEDLLETVAYMLLYLKYTHNHSPEYEHINVVID